MKCLAAVLVEIGKPLIIDRIEIPGLSFGPAMPSVGHVAPSGFVRPRFRHQCSENPWCVRRVEKGRRTKSSPLISGTP